METTLQVPYPNLRKLVHSKYLDLFAVAIILTVSLSLHYHQTFYYQGKAHSGVPLSEWGNLLRNGAFPLGIFSTIVACFSMLSTRFVGKQSNTGNVIGILTTISVCIIEFLLGNKSAVITYPVTFFITIFATVKWSRGEKIKPKDTLYYIMLVAGIILGYALVFVGFYLFDHTFGWYSDFKSKLLFHTLSLTFGISLAANTASALKYQETWINWFVYNLIQIVKKILLKDWATVGKYLFYIFNSIITFFDWKWNKDRIK